MVIVPCTSKILWIPLFPVLPYFLYHNLFISINSTFKGFLPSWQRLWMIIVNGWSDRDSLCPPKITLACRHVSSPGWAGWQLALQNSSGLCWYRYLRYYSYYYFIILTIVFYFTCSLIKYWHILALTFFLTTRKVYP